jgi:transposase
MPYSEHGNKRGTYGKIRHILPVQRGRVTVKNITFINALPYICENGCNRRRLPKEYGCRHVIYKRFNRRVRDGITGRLFRELHAGGIVETAQPVLLLDSMSVPVHPNACGALKKRARSR